MREILPGIWTWSVYNAEKQMNFNGWYLRKDKEAVVIDPPPPSPDDLKEIAQRGSPVAILLTNKHHTRATSSIRDTFGCPVWVHEADRPLMEIPVDRTYRDRDLLPCGLRAITVPGGKTPGETAFLLEGAARTLIVGDAVLGKPPGSLSMLPADKFKDASRALAGLLVLVDQDFEALLLGDGEPVLSGGRKLLERFVRRDGLG